MHRSARALGIALVAVAVGPALLGTIALADGGCGAPGRPSCTVMRPSRGALPAPAPLGAGDCLVLVGGLGSTAGSTALAFEHLVADLEVDISVLDYDALGTIAVAAEALRGHVERISASCAAVHIVAHSMGGVVADRAFSKGLSSDDRVVTYVPLASPHNGSNMARQICGIGEVDETYTELLRAVAALLDQPDPTAPAICDLAQVKAPRPPRGVSTARVRLVTDPLVLRRDHVAPYRDVRELLPEAPAEIEGHGGILRSQQAQVLVRGSIAARAVPPDLRTEAQRQMAAVASTAADAAGAVAHVVTGAALWTGALVARVVTRLPVFGSERFLP